MRLTDFTLYNNNAAGSGTVAWSAVNDAGGTVYEVTQAQGALDCIWTSSWNNLVTKPSWVTKLGFNGPNVLYAIDNALASGIIHSDAFINNTPLPTTGVWAGYVPRIVGVDTYNFEIFTAGAPVANDGQNQGLGGFLNGQATFGDAATLDWYLGGGGGLQHHLYVSTNGNCGAKSPCYSSIQAAIDAAGTGSTVSIAEGTYTEAINLTKSKTLTLQAGWDSSFSTQTSNTTFIKAPRVTQGSLTLQMVTIKP